jgi:EAL domain-containing protein (putative c-di-GMP-specific phosphodiesterase class I)
MENTKDPQSKIYELDNILSIKNYSREDFQSAICWSLIDTSYDKLFRQMVIALEASDKKCGIVAYKGGILDELHKEYLLLSKLKSSLRAKLARFAYQPIIKCSSGETAYYECLLRIPDDDGELMSAGKSILLSEKYGLINYVDRSVIELAAKELKANEGLMLSINISNLGLLDDRLEDVITSHLKERKIASRLIIEITETAINNDFERISDFISFVKNLGCKIAIDDFGSGATSISHLKNLKFDILKIDGSLTRNVLDSDYNMYLVKTIVALAGEVRAKTVAEFVENGRIAKFLMDSGIDYMQGNFFSPAQNFRTWSNK